MLTVHRNRSEKGEEAYSKGWSEWSWKFSWFEAWNREIPFAGQPHQDGQPCSCYLFCYHGTSEIKLGLLLHKGLDNWAFNICQIHPARELTKPFLTLPFSGYCTTLLRGLFPHGIRCVTPKPFLGWLLSHPEGMGTVTPCSVLSFIAAATRNLFLTLVESFPSPSHGNSTSYWSSWFTVTATYTFLLCFFHCSLKFDLFLLWNDMLLVFSVWCDHRD